LRKVNKSDDLNFSVLFISYFLRKYFIAGCSTYLYTKCATINTANNAMDEEAQMLKLKYSMKKGMMIKVPKK
jgi:hypothetical protein